MRETLEEKILRLIKEKPDIETLELIDKTKVPGVEVMAVLTKLVQDGSVHTEKSKDFVEYYNGIARVKTIGS